jgi:hypothetical protein
MTRKLIIETCGNLWVLGRACSAAQGTHGEARAAHYQGTRALSNMATNGQSYGRQGDSPRPHYRLSVDPHLTQRRQANRGNVVLDGKRHGVSVSRMPRDRLLVKRHRSISNKRLTQQLSAFSSTGFKPVL